MKVRKDAPTWMVWAIREATDGIAEEPNRDNRGPVIARYIALAKAGRQGDPYCAIAVNAAFEYCGIEGTRSAAARSFEWDGGKKFVKLKGPAYGAVSVFWRGSKKSGTGHVGFYVGETEHHVYTLGANQGDDFNESPFPKNGRSFGLVGHYWPAGVPKPAVETIRLAGNGKPIKDTKAT
jgi:uncharacterized protein (TIGR02594 family)